MKGIVYLSVLYVLAASCARDKSCENCTPELTEAMIINSGVVAADGCDWVVRVADTLYYHPESLADEFKQNELPVTVKFELTGDTFHCGLAGTGLPVIKLLEISK